MRVWKIVGLAGVVGITTVGAVAGTRAVQRQRREYREADPNELRARLRERLAAAEEAPAGSS